MTIFLIVKYFLKGNLDYVIKILFFYVSVPEGCIVTYFNISNLYSITNFENNKKYMKRMNIFIN